jgi:iron complex transport system substrate-binding protein
VRALALALGLLCPMAAGALTVEDDRGVAVVLDSPAERVVSLAPFITELIFAVGAGDRLVAVSEHSDYPDAALDLPRVGNAINVNLERLLSTRPDLVISWRTGVDPRIVQRLETMAVPVFVLEPRTLEDVPKALRRIGRLLGSSDEAQRKAREFTSGVDGLREQYAGRSRVTVFYQISLRPLMTLNGRHMVSDILNLCGGSNVFQDFAPIAPTVNREQVLARDPDAILVSATDGQSSDSITYWRRYPAMKAVRLDNVYTVDGNLLNRQTPRLAEGVKKVCAILESVRAKEG